MDTKKLQLAGRKLVRLLRHIGLSYGLRFDSEGYVLIQEILRCQFVNNFKLSMDELDWIIDNNNKKRLGYNEDRTKIRCHQGHSRDISSLLDPEKIYKRVSDSTEIIPCMHGTYTVNLRGINIDGLLPMDRHMIHMTNRRDFFRKSVEVVIYIDVEKAIKDGMIFYVSGNGVILSNGINGKIGTQYFSNIEFT